MQREWSGAQVKAVETAWALPCIRSQNCVLPTHFPAWVWSQSWERATTTFTRRDETWPTAHAAGDQVSLCCPHQRCHLHPYTPTACLIIFRLKIKEVALVLISGPLLTHSSGPKALNLGRCCQCGLHCRGLFSDLRSYAFIPLTVRNHRSHCSASHHISGTQRHRHSAQVHSWTLMVTGPYFLFSGLPIRALPHARNIFSSFCGLNTCHWRQPVAVVCPTVQNDLLTRIVISRSQRPARQCCQGSRGAGCKLLWQLMPVPTCLSHQWPVLIPLFPADVLFVSFLTQQEASRDQK